MSFLNLFYEHPLVMGSSLVLAGFGSGFAVNQYFSDQVGKVENLSKETLTNDVSELQDNVIAQDQRIYSLTSELAHARDELVNRSNRSGSDDVALKISDEKYSTVVQDYNKLSGMYQVLQANYSKAQQNCNVLDRIRTLEQKRSRLETSLSSVQYDTFEKDPVGRKSEIGTQLQQIHQELLEVQRNLIR